MNLSVLITRLKHDDALTYLYYYSGKVKEFANKKNIKVFLCDENDVTKNGIESRIRKLSPNFIFLNGHGERDFIAGHKNEVLIKVGENEEILKNSIAYIRSCNTASELGPKAIESGAKGFIGYEQPFIFPQDTNKITKPLEDNVAKPTLESSNIIPISIINGDNLKGACEKSIETTEKWLNKIRSSEFPFHYDLMIMSLFWNMSVLKRFGDDDITINS